MAILGTINKQPAEVLDFDISYASILAGRNDTLASATASSDPVGIIVVGSTVNPDTHITNVKISSGTDTNTYKITVQSTTTGGLVYEDEVNVVVNEI